MAAKGYVLLVIYQKNGERSAACESLRRLRYPYVLIVDNSERDFGNQAYAAACGWDYLKMPGNSGLAKAYNAGIDRLRGKADHVVLFDDDTIIDAAYIGALRYALCVSPDSRILLPTVYDREGLLSPCRIRRFRVFRAERPQDIPPDEMSGINSGMVISMAVFDDYRYDERYFLDFVDHAFLRDMRRRGEPIDLLDATLRQNFSGSDDRDRAKAVWRYACFRRDCRVYFDGEPRGRWYYLLAVCRRRLGMEKQLYRRWRRRRQARRNEVAV